jgi:hypothetical protein
MLCGWRAASPFPAAALGGKDGSGIFGWGDFMGAALELLGQLGIEAVPIKAPKGEGKTAALRTIERLIKTHGPPHTTLVLRAITESSGNSGELTRQIILAVSDVLALHRRWADSGLALLEAFDSIKLGELRRTVKAARMSCGRRDAIAILLFLELQKRLGPPSPPRGR